MNEQLESSKPLQLKENNLQLHPLNTDLHRAYFSVALISWESGWANQNQPKKKCSYWSFQWFNWTSLEMDCSKITEIFSMETLALTSCMLHTTKLQLKKKEIYKQWV